MDMCMYINGVFLFEMLVYILMIGSIAKAYNNRFHVWPETLCQIINGFACTMYIMNYTDESAYRYIIKYF